jgi:two-component system chemotaxis response regulator CheB
VTKVLVVDDSALARKMLGEILTANDLDVRFARDGVEALAQLHAFRPDVVTLDIRMPAMDGLACLDRIMIERPCAVVMVSTLTAAGAEATLEALDLGAVDFIAKPGGAISLGIAEMAPLLVEKIRAAAVARPRISRRLAERVRHHIGRTASAPRHGPRAAPGTLDGLVLVGTSTGGPPALEALLVPLAPDFPWPILIAQHMPASFTGTLARRLDAMCAVAVQEVRGLTVLRPGVAYIGRGDADLIVSRRTGGLVAITAPGRAEYPWHPSADRLVRTAMQQLPARQLVGVLMTGMGSDGAGAMAELREAGGQTIAEAEETAVVWGMPGELVRAGGADWVLPLPAIAPRLRRLVA